MNSFSREPLGEDIAFDYNLPESEEAYLSSYMLQYLYEHNVLEHYTLQKGHFHTLYGSVKKSVFGIPQFSHAKIVAKSANQLHIYYFTDRIVHRIIHIKMEVLE